MTMIQYEIHLTIALVLCLVGFAVMAYSSVQVEKKYSDNAFALGARTTVVGMLILGYVGVMI